MIQIAPDEFHALQFHLLQLAIVSIVTIFEAYLLCPARQDAMVAQRGAVDIAPQITQQIGRLPSGGLDVDFPLLTASREQHLLDIQRSVLAPAQLALLP